MANINGTIDLCPHQNCGFRCCQFNQGNYIVLYPGEIEQARTASQSLNHLTIIDDDYFGGARAVCSAADTSICDGGYKPLDCATYPFFPVIGMKGDAIKGVLKGSKCPLTVADLSEHNVWVQSIWQAVIAINPAIAEWLRHVKLVGYQSVQEAVEEAS